MERSAREQASLLPRAPGVYRFRDATGKVLYLGRATSLRRRVASYWGDLKERRHLAPMVAKIAGVEAVACDSAHEAAWLERNLLQARKPPWNRVDKGGQEVEVWIRLSEDQRGPGLTAVHERNQDMARIRGICEGDRAVLAETAVAVLARNPAAVSRLRTSLVARRDAASATLAFEFAAKLHEEIEAIDWVTAEQKVTGQEAAECDIAGWSAGILVSFAIRNGRLVNWAQRACQEAMACRHLAGTPLEWTAFAQRR